MRFSFFTYLILLLSVVFISQQVNLQSAAVFFTAVIVSIILSRIVSLGLSSSHSQTLAKTPEQSAIFFGSKLFFIIFWGGLFSLATHISLQRFHVILCPGFNSNVIGMIAIIILPLALLGVFSLRPTPTGTSHIVRWIAELVSGLIFIAGLTYYGLSHWLSTETAFAWWASGLFMAALISVVVAWVSSGKNKSVSLKAIMRSFSVGVNDFLRGFFLILGYYVAVITAFRFLDASLAGAFILAMLFGELIWRLPESFVSASAPASATPTGLTSAKALGLNLLFSWAVIITGVALTGYFAVSYALLRSSTISSWYLILIILPGMIGFMFTRRLIAVFASAKHNFFTVVSSILIFAVHFDLSLIMLTQWGVVGVASAFAATYFFSGSFFVFIYKNKTKCNWGEIFKFSLRSPLVVPTIEQGGAA